MEKLVVYVLYFLIPIGIIHLIDLLINYHWYKISNYKNESKNNFFDTFYDKGNYGEFRIFIKLEKIKDYKKILTNTYIMDDNNKSHESDLVLIHKTGIYVFESKNYRGWIFGREDDKYWTQMFYNKDTKKKYKFRFYNPIMQNRTHVRVLNQYLENTFQGFIQSYIVFSNGCELKKVNFSIQNCILCKRNKMMYYLRKDFNNKTEVLSDNEIEVLYNKIKNNISKEKVDEKNQQIEQIHQYNQKIEKEMKPVQPVIVKKDEQIIQELKQFRLKQAQLENVPFYYIFNDDTLNDLLIKKPKNIEELINVKGYAEIKANKYGINIIDIINKNN